MSDLCWLFGRNQSDNQRVIKNALPLMDSPPNSRMKTCVASGFQVYSRCLLLG
jgi:hypothetical protein